MHATNEHRPDVNIVKDDVGERCQKLFQDFLEEYVNTIIIRNIAH